MKYLQPNIRVGLAIACIGCMSAACAVVGGFEFLQDDNDPDALATVMQGYQVEDTATPRNITGKPLAFVVTRPIKDKKISKSLVAYDLSSNKILWKQTTDVTSRVVVGREFVAHLQGDGSLIGRDVRDGRVLWTKKLNIANAKVLDAIERDDKAFLGLTADRDRVIYVMRSGSEWWAMTALDGKTGQDLWTSSAPGQLGVPLASGGLVFSPFLKQWLSVLDARTGKPLTRILSKDEAITFVRAEADKVWFGNRRRIALLDESAAGGEAAKYRSLKAVLPAEFVQPHYSWDAFDVVQAGYSAYDRNRILWAAQAQGEDLRFAQDAVVVHSYRFFFAFGAQDSDLKWAYKHPSSDIVSSTRVQGSDGEGAIVFVSGHGEFGVLDSKTGARLYKAKIDARLLGATLDVAGFRPQKVLEPVRPTAEVLVGIARDRNRRFNAVKEFAIAILADIPGGDITASLLGIVQDPRTTKKVYDRAIEVLIKRADPKGLPYLLKSLEQRFDFFTGAKPTSLGVVAQVMASLKNAKLSRKDRERAVSALLVHVQDPNTPAQDLRALITALGAFDTDRARVALRQFVLVYRTDPSFAKELGPLSVAVDLLLAGGRVYDRELVGFVAGDLRSQRTVANYARRALAQTAAIREPVEPTNSGGKAKSSKPSASAKLAPATTKPQAATTKPAVKKADPTVRP